MIKSLQAVFWVKSIRKKIIATLAIVLVYKFLAVIPVPWADTDALKTIFENNANSGLSFFSALMGGWMENFSIILITSETKLKAFFSITKLLSQN